LTIVLAHFTSKYVEEPLRHKNLSSRTIYKGASITTAISLVAGVLIAFTSSSIITTKGEPSYQFDFQLSMVMVAMLTTVRLNLVTAPTGIRNPHKPLFFTEILMLPNGFLPLKN